MTRDINRAREADRDISDAQSALRQLTGVLGLTLEETETDGSADVDALIDLLIHTRAALRVAKQYDLADSIRDQLADLGYVLEDNPAGTTWKRA